MAVAARFWVQKVNKSLANGSEIHREVILQPVIRPTDDNVAWSKYTPSGEIRLVVTAAGAGEWFEERLGKDVAITFDDPAE